MFIHSHEHNHCNREIYKILPCQENKCLIFGTSVLMRHIVDIDESRIIKKCASLNIYN